MKVNVTEHPLETLTTLENTDKYALFEYGQRKAFAMFNKKRGTSYLIGTKEGVGFFEYYRNALVAWGTEGSTYYGLTKDQVLAQVFSAYSHREMYVDLAPSDYLDAVDAQQH